MFQNGTATKCYEKYMSQKQIKKTYQSSSCYEDQINDE